MSCGRRGPGSGTSIQWHELVVRVDDAVVHVGRGRRVVEHEHLAGVLVDLRCAPRCPSRTGSGRSTTRARAVRACADRTRRGRRTGRSVVSARPACTTTSVLDASFMRVRAPQPSARSERRRAARGCRPTAARPASFSASKPCGAHEAVAVLGVAVAEADHVQHAVAVERVVPADRVVHRVLGVAEVDAVEVVGDLAHDVEVGRVVLERVRRPRARAVRVVVVGRQRRQHSPHDMRFHDANPTPDVAQRVLATCGDRNGRAVSPKPQPAVPVDFVGARRRDRRQVGDHRPARDQLGIGPARPASRCAARPGPRVARGRGVGKHLDEMAIPGMGFGGGDRQRLVGDAAQRADRSGVAPDRVGGAARMPRDEQHDQADDEHCSDESNLEHHCT